MRPSAKSGRKNSAEDERLRTQIKKLACLEERAFGPRSGRFDFYRYLEAVLKVYWSWEDDEARKSRREKVGELYGIPSRKGRKALHVLIEATSKQKSQTKNRWVQALQFAATRRAEIGRKGFEAFCQANGGIAGCSRKWATRKKGLKTPNVSRLLNLSKLFPSASTASVPAPSRTLASAGSNHPKWRLGH